MPLTLRATIRTTLLTMVPILLADAPCGAAGAAAQEAAPVLAEASDGGQYWATVQPISAVRSGDVLTISLRFLAGEDLASPMPHTITFYEEPEQGYEAIYVIADDQRYFPLRDEDGTPLIPPRFEMKFVQSAGRALWTGRFPAPPPEIDTVSMTFPLTSAIDAIPISDR